MLLGTSACYEVVLKRQRNGDSVHESDGTEHGEKDETRDDGDDEHENEEDEDDDADEGNEDDEGEDFDDEGEDDKCFKDIKS